ncbi:glycosyltransferase [Bilophila sp.]|uniref:glycosyltransferase n=1 Tax=Bilophila sp. TaxID=1929485 RepID=UPI0030786899
MNTRAPSPLACLFLLPCAYVCEGSFRNVRKTLARGWPYFYELLADRHRIGKACADLPHWEAVTILSFFFGASYLQRHGGLYYGLVNVVAKLRKFGLRGMLFASLAEIHKLAIQRKDNSQNFLLCFDKNARAGKGLLTFLHCLKTASYNVEAFTEQDDLFAKNIASLRKLGVYRAFARSHSASVADYCYEVGDCYSGFLVPVADLKHSLLDTMRYVSPHGIIFCICDDTSELRAVDSSLLEKIDHIICYTISFIPAHVSLLAVPESDKNLNIEIDKIVHFLARCEILPPKCIADYYAKQSISTQIRGVPVVSLAIQLHEDASTTRNMVVALLTACEKAGLACEIIFWGKKLPEWVSQLAVAWKHLDIPPVLFLEHLDLIEKSCSCDAVLLVKDGTLLLKGLDSALAILKQSPEVHLCGCRLLAADGSLHGAGAQLKDGHIVPIGQGESFKAPFFRITRSVPLLSLHLLLFKKGVGLFSTERKNICLLEQSEGFIGFTDNSSLAVLCADLEAYLPDVGQPLQQQQGKGLSDEEAAALAAQDRYIPATVNETDRPVRILYYSPYPSHPASHGNRSTIQFFGKIFREKGCEAHFGLLELDRCTPEDMAAMHRAWDSVATLPYPFHDESHLGVDVPFDGWYEKGLGEHIAWLCSLHSVDVLFCSYVFQSKMLEFVPKHILKVIDTHDKMGGRYAAQKARGVKTEFFSCSPEDEGRYLRRADIVIARREEEARYFNEVSGQDSAIVIPHVEPPHFLQRSFERVHAVGLVASANRINLDLVTDFLHAVQSQQAAPPFEVRIAGQVSTMIKDVSACKREVFHCPWVKILGFVEDIAGFYADVDLVVSPVTLGTGINVKTVQAMSYGMPLVTTAFGCKGIETGHPMHSHATVEEVAAAVFHIFRQPQLLGELAECSRQRYRTFYETSLEGFDFLIQQARNKNREKE